MASFLPQMGSILRPSRRQGQFVRFLLRNTVFESVLLVESCAINYVSGCRG